MDFRKGAPECSQLDKVFVFASIKLSCEGNLFDKTHSSKSQISILEHEFVQLNVKINFSGITFGSVSVIALSAKFFKFSAVSQYTSVH